MLLLCIPLNIKAHELPVQKVEGEIRLGIGLPIGKYHEGFSTESLNLGAECRYNFNRTPFDIGAAVDLTTAVWNYRNVFHDGYDHLQNNRTVSIVLVGDYNLRQGSKINPFAGIGVGVGFHDEVGDRVYPHGGTSFCIKPRIGVELIYHVRVSCQLNVCKKGYNNISFNLSLLLGGRPKK